MSANVSAMQPSWRSQARAALAIARKDGLHFARYPLNAIFRVFHPLIWLTPVYFLGKTFAAAGSAGFAAYTGVADYMSFILLGTVLSSYVAAVFWGMGLSLKNDMNSGVLESNWLTPVPRPIFLVGQTVANLAITTATNAVMLALARALFGFRVTGDLLAALGVALPMLIALYGFGFGFAAVVLLLRDANMLIDVADYLVTMFSGSTFPVRVLPWFLLPISLALPLTYGYDAVRGILLGSATLIPLGYEIVVLVAFMGAMVPLGSAVFHRVERRCRTLGTLGMH